MRGSTIFVVTSSLLLLAACTRTIVVRGPDRQDRGSRPPPRAAPEPDRPPPPPVRTYEVLIPPGHLPSPGQCRVWISGRSPGRQPRPRSRPCAGIEAIAPPGSWIVYRRADDPSWVYLRVVDERRAGIVIRNRIYDLNTWEMVRDDEVRDNQPGDDRRDPVRRRDPPPQDRPREPQDRPQDRPREQPKPPERPADQQPRLPPREVIPPVQPPAQQPPPGQQPPVQPPGQQPPPVQPPPGQQPPPVQPPPAEPPPPSNVTLDIPPGHLPEIGECRLWIPGLPPGQEPRPKSRACAGITGIVPAGSWIIYRPSDDRTVVHVRLIDERRAGVVIRIRIFDLDSKRLLREENP